MSFGKERFLLENSRCRGGMMAAVRSLGKAAITPKSSKRTKSSKPIKRAGDLKSSARKTATKKRPPAARKAAARPRIVPVIVLDEEYTAREFADREPQLEKVKAKIEEAQDAAVAEIDKPLIEYFAVKGQGKSWLLRRIAEKFALENSIASDSVYAKPPLTASVDFDDLVQNPALHSFEIIRTLSRQLLEQSKLKFKIPHLDSKHIPSPKQYNQTVAKFVAFVQALSRSFVPILIFDSTDHADEQVLEWVEEKVVFPLIQSNKIIFVFGGRRRLFWKFYEVRRRVDAQELLPLDEKGTAEQVKRLEQDPGVASLLFEYSKGHPQINRRILYALQTERGITQLGPLIFDAERKFILNSVAHIVDNQFLAGLSREAHKLTWDICVLRKFHTAALRYFAGVENEQKRKKPEGYYLDLIQEMIDLALAHWDSDRGGYVLDSTVRKVMVENLQDRNQSRFVKLEEDAWHMYNEWRREYPAHSQTYLLEMVYNKLNLVKIGHQSPQQMLQKLDATIGDQKFPISALKDEAFPSSFRADEEINELLEPYQGLRDQILERVASAYAKKQK